jgi:EAL domain-containing protein (putative c-di-GMP-specific phosphodiesterase class I)
MKTESICGFEALARLKTSELGSVTPGEFIPIAEKSKLIIPIGDKIILRALDFQSRLEKEGFEVLSTAINISVIQLLVPGFADTLIGMVHEKRIDPKNITIEITESVFEYDFDYINSVLVELRKSGLTLAIDDFGTGYSSLSREMHLDVDCIKIDKFFIDHILEIEKPITCDIIEIAHKQEHYVVGEGVEHVKQLQYLKDHGCDRVQGYLISKPLDEDVAVKFINEFVYDH